MNLKIKAQYKITAPEIPQEEKQQQKKLNDKIKNVVKFFTNDISYKIIKNKDKYDVIKIDKQNIKSNKRKQNITIIIPVEANSDAIINQLDKLKNDLYKYINSDFELKIIGTIESLEVIEDDQDA